MFEVTNLKESQT